MFKLASVLSLIAAPVVAEPVCDFQEVMEEKLKEKYGESLQVAGLMPDGVLMQFFANGVTGTWTITTTGPTGVSCIAGIGENYIVFIPSNEPAKPNL